MKNKIKFCFNLHQNILCVLMMLCVACAQPQEGGIHKIDAAQTARMINEQASVQLVDLRTPGEVQRSGKIAGARLYNFNGPDFKSQIGTLDKTQPVILYCAAGSRSAQAAAQLKQMGFQQVYDYTGGMNDWQAKGNKTVE